jgi:hypothetical protein
MAAGKFGSFVSKMVTKAQKEGTRSGPSEVAEKAKLAEVGRMKKTELEKIASNPDSDYYSAAKRELKRREDVRSGTESKAVRAMGREKATGTRDIREAAERSVEEKRMLSMSQGGATKKKEAYKSERTKKLEKAKVGKEDMPGFKEIVRKGALGLSRGMDKVEGAFKSKDKEEKEYAKGGSVKGFKPCPGCPTPAKCKAAGKCLMKEKAKMPSKGSKKAATGMLVIPVSMSKAPAKKGKKG